MSIFTVRDRARNIVCHTSGSACAKYAILFVFSRLADLFGNNKFSWGLGVIISSVFFGLGHMYQGLAGVVETFVFGTVMACLYLADKRNLWTPISFMAWLIQLA